MQKPLDNFRIHSGDDFLGSLVDVVFHCRDLGLGVEQIGVRVNGDHVTHGRLVCQLVGLHIFVYYRTNRAAAEFIACPSGYTIHFFREADLSEIPSADCKSAVICYQSISLVILSTPKRVIVGEQQKDKYFHPPVRRTGALYRFAMVSFG